MKIVIATAVYYPMINGVANFSHNLAEGLARRGNEVLVITPSQNGESYQETVNGVRVAYLRSVQMKVYPDQIHGTDDSGVEAELMVTKMHRVDNAVDDGAKARRKSWRKKWHFPWYKYGLRVSVFPRSEVKRILDEFQPDVVHVQVSDPIGLSVVGYARRNSIPVVTTEHNQPEVLTSSLHLGALRKPANYLLAAYFRNRQSKSDFVTMPTEKAIFNLLSGHKDIGVLIAAVSNGVDLSHFTPGRTSMEIYKKYGLSQDERYILYVGRVDPEKKIGVVIEAFKEARPKLPKNVKLLIVGDGTDLARLRKKVVKMGLEEDVRFLGKVLPPDLYEIYRVGEVFVTASEVETQGIVLIEAAATGLPLIAVDKGAVAEVCKDGENGFLCRAGDIRGMAEATTRIVLDAKLREKLAQKSVEIAREHDFERTLDKFENIYRHVMKK